MKRTTPLLLEEFIRVFSRDPPNLNLPRGRSSLSLSSERVTDWVFPNLNLPRVRSSRSVRKGDPQISILQGEEAPFPFLPEEFPIEIPQNLSLPRRRSSLFARRVFSHFTWFIGWGRGKSFCLIFFIWSIYGWDTYMIISRSDLPPSVWFFFSWVYNWMDHRYDQIRLPSLRFFFSSDLYMDGSHIWSDQALTIVID